MNKSARVRELIGNGLPVTEIVKKAKVTPGYIYTIRWNMKKNGNGKPSPKENIAVITPIKEEVDHPEHYTQGGIETWDFIDAKGLSYHLASVVKYVSRAGKKPGASELKDLMKARNHLDRRIKQLVESRKV